MDLKVLLAQWEQVNKEQELLIKTPTNKPNRESYREEVWRLTELNDLSVLKHHDKRGFNNYHLDHIIPLKYGWKHQLPPEYIANIRNLRFIPWRDNLKKGFQLTSKAKHLLESHPPRSI